MLQDFSILQDFLSVSDHFMTLRSKGLNQFLRHFLDGQNFKIFHDFSGNENSVRFFYCTIFYKWYLGIIFFQNIS